MMNPSLVAVSIDEPEPVSDDKAELEKLVTSSDTDLDKIVKFESCYSVMIPETFLSSGISTADIVADNPVYHIDLCNLHDDKTVIAGSKTKTYRLNKVNTAVVYDDYPQAQMDGGAGVSVISLVSLLHNVKYFNDKFKSRDRIHGTTLREIITPHAVGLMKVRSLTRQE